MQRNTGFMVVIPWLVCLGIVLVWNYDNDYLASLSGTHKRNEASLKMAEDHVTKANLKDWLEVLKSKKIRIGFSVEHHCEDLFQYAESNMTKLSSAYAKRKAALEQHFKALSTRLKEGHAGTLQEQELLYWTLGGIPSVRTVCEIGFNAGHSSLIWLQSNPNIHLHSFDLGRHAYTKPMAEYLQEQYPERIDFYFGSSTDTVPAVTKNISCDIINVDGGHTGEQPVIDVNNMKRFAHKDSLLLVDDTAHGAGFSEPVLKAVNKLQSRRVIQLYFMCSYKAMARGFSVFKYIFD